MYIDSGSDGVEIMYKNPTQVFFQTSKLIIHATHDVTKALPTSWPGPPDGDETIATLAL